MPTNFPMVRPPVQGGADARKRPKWFPPGAARLEINSYAQPGGKSRINIQLTRPSKKSDVDRERAVWKKALTILDTLLSA